MRAALLAVALSLSSAGPAVAFPSASLTLDPQEPGARTLARISLRWPRGAGTRPDLLVRVARGTKVDIRAAARVCGNELAAEDECPSASRIGGGTASLEATPGGPRTAVDIDVYRAPLKRSDDVARLVMVTRAAGRTSFAPGRVLELSEAHYPRKGLQLNLRSLRRAFFGMGLRGLNVHLGTHRTVNGRRADLITNPATCPAEGWRWTIAFGQFRGSQNLWHGSIDCS